MSDLRHYVRKAAGCGIAVCYGLCGHGLLCGCLAMSGELFSDHTDISGGAFPQYL